MVDKWTSAHNKILVLTRMDKPVPEIAKAVNLSANLVGKIRNSEVFKNRVAIIEERLVARTTERLVKHDYKARAREILENAAIGAAKTVVRVAKDKGKSSNAVAIPRARIQLDAAKDILDRIGLKAVEVIETRERVYSPEEILRAQSTLLEIEGVLKRIGNQESAFVLRKSVTTLAASTIAKSVPDDNSLVEESSEEDPQSELAPPSETRPPISPA